MPNSRKALNYIEEVMEDMPISRLLAMKIITLSQEHVMNDAGNMQKR